MAACKGDSLALDLGFFELAEFQSYQPRNCETIAVKCCHFGNRSGELLRFWKSVRPRLATKTQITQEPLGFALEPGKLRFLPGGGPWLGRSQTAISA